MPARTTPRRSSPRRSSARSTPAKRGLSSVSSATTSVVKTASRTKRHKDVEAEPKKEDAESAFDQETVSIYGEGVTQAMIDANEKAAKESKKKLDDDEEWNAFEKKKKKFERTLTFEQKRTKLEDLLKKAEAYTDFLAKRHQQYVNSAEGSAVAQHKFVQPPNMTGGAENLKLRPYQERGAAWLEGLCFNGLHGILADEMGLGKTIQIIAVIAHVKHKGMAGPFIVIAPLSTLKNWESEFNRWCPGMNTLLYHGTREEREMMRMQHMGMTMTKNGTSHRRGNGRVEKDFPVIITSYDIAMRDSSHLSRFTWAYLVVDEGHRLKNKDCRLMKELKRLNANQRVLLTGTPLQNNLSELWSLLNFLMPDAFDDLQFFQAWFGWDSKDGDMTEKIKKDNEGNNIIQKLHSILNPFMMRRLKRDVAKYLPAKKEIIVYAGMTPDQRSMYKAIENDLSLFSKQLKTVKKLEGKKYTSMLNRVMQMRKVCNHPYLVHDQEETTEHLVESSGKLKLLDRMLGKLLPEGHKCLIFSQFTTMLDIIEDFFVLRGMHHRVCRIDGGVKLDDRQNQIEEFNTEGSQKSIFLLSTRAGGVGINLATADTVIIYDSDWNPHMDNQAQDRAHRIGQKNDVFVYRLCMESSVETLILERANAKRSLSRMTMAGNFAGNAKKKSTATSLKKDIIDELLSDDIKMADSLVKGTRGGISEKELEMILDRSLVMGTKGKKTPKKRSPKKRRKMAEKVTYDPLIPMKGKGYQIVEHKAESLVGGHDFAEDASP